jgi:release factor glutamine methyltransferase
LSAADSGLKDLRTIIRGAVDYLVPGGWLILEHGYDQGPAIADCLAQRGYDPVKRHRDLSGHHRVTAARHNNN